MGAHSCRGPLPAHGPSILRANGGPSMPRTHPSGGLIPAHGPSNLRADGPRSMPTKHQCRWPIPAQGPSIPKGHGGHLCPGPIPAQAHPSRGVMRANPSPGPIDPEDPSGAIHLGGNGFFLRVIFILGEIDFRNFWGNVFRGNFRFGIFGGNCFGENI